MFTGTTIVATRTPNEIIIGADSKRVDTASGAVSYACKIHVVNNMAIVFAGNVKETKSEFAFDAYEMAKEVCVKNTSIKDKIAEFGNIVGNNFHKLLGQMYTRNPNLYRSITSEEDGRKKPVLTTMFAGVEKGKLIHCMLRIFANVENKQVVIDGRLECCEVGNCDIEEPFSLVAFGQADNIVKYITSNPDYRSIGKIATIKKLINMEITPTSKFTGGKISVVKLNLQGITWIQKGECQDNPSNKPKKPVKKKSRHK